MNTTDPGASAPLDGPAPRRRRRRHTPARRFTGVGRHGAGDSAAVEEALALQAEEHEPAPLPVAPLVDEFDASPEPPETMWWSAQAPDGETLGEASDAAWLAWADQEAQETEHHGDGFAHALARFGAAPAGYLPAQDVFGADQAQVEADMAARRKRKRRRSLTLVSIVLVFLLAVAGGGYVLLRQFTAPPADYPGPGSGAVTFTVQKGWGSKQIGRHLVEAGIVKSTGAFDAAVANDASASFQPGDFELKKEMSAAGALEALSGSGRAAVSYFALTPNLRMNASLKAISEGTGLSLEQLTAAAKKPASFGLPDSATNLEGWLHPGEYRFAHDATVKEVLGGLVKATRKTLEDTGISDPEEQQRTLTIASIVMAEGLKSDYAKVAGVIENRLGPNNTETHGLLQSDATVIYGLDRYSLLVSREEQADTSNPYNTYKHKGLPPTPIGSPNDDAIKAAAHPQASDDFYWVTVDLDTGETLFAKTYAEHLNNIEKYRAWCTANAGRCK